MNNYVMGMNGTVSISMPVMQKTSIAEGFA